MTYRHTTSPSRRESIAAAGLLPHKPSGSYLSNQPRGVYAVPLDAANVYTWDEYGDVWTFDYDGPLKADPIIEGAVVIPEAIPPELLTLALENGDPCDLHP